MTVGFTLFDFIISLYSKFYNLSSNMEFDLIASCSENWCEARRCCLEIMADRFFELSLTYVSCFCALRLISDSDFSILLSPNLIFLLPLLRLLSYLIACRSTIWVSVRSSPSSFTIRFCFLSSIMISACVFCCYLSI